MSELSISPAPGSEQATFENLLASHFGIRPGALALDSNCKGATDQYVNMHVQWMWEQYRRHATHKPT